LPKRAIGKNEEAAARVWEDANRGIALSQNNKNGGSEGSAESDSKEAHAQEKDGRDKSDFFERFAALEKF
jgi:hypothetical protein